MIDDAYFFTDEAEVWQNFTREQFFKGYSNEDAVYDSLSYV